MYRSLLVTGLALVVASWATVGAQEALPGPDEPDGRFAIVETGGSVVMLDQTTGQSWFLHIRDQEVVWLPIRRVDDVGEAKHWLEDGADPLLDASLVSDLARARAQLKRLEAQYGAQHPLVLSAREAVRELQAVLR